MSRSTQFVLECLAGLLAAGAVLGAGIPLLHLVADPIPRAAALVLAWGVPLGFILLATLRPGGSLRR